MLTNEAEVVCVGSIGFTLLIYGRRSFADCESSHSIAAWMFLTLLDSREGTLLIHAGGGGFKTVNSEWIAVSSRFDIGVLKFREWKVNSIQLSIVTHQSALDWKLDLDSRYTCQLECRISLACWCPAGQWLLLHNMQGRTARMVSKVAASSEWSWNIKLIIYRSLHENLPLLYVTKR